MIKGIVDFKKKKHLTKIIIVIIFFFCMQRLIEDMVMFVQQMSDHMTGNIGLKHKARACVICQPHVCEYKQICMKQNIIIPASYPSDADYEFFKREATNQTCMKRLYIESMQNWSIEMKEWVFLASTLNYSVQNNCIATWKLFIICFDVFNSSLNFDQKFNRHIQISKQCILFTFDVNKKYIKFDSNMFVILFENWSQVRLLQLFVLKKLGRLHVEQVIDFCNSTMIKFIIGDDYCKESSFLY